MQGSAAASPTVQTPSAQISVERSGEAKTGMLLLQFKVLLSKLKKEELRSIEWVYRVLRSSMISDSPHQFDIGWPQK